MLQIQQHNFQLLRVYFVTLTCLKSLRKKKTKTKVHRTKHIKAQKHRETFLAVMYEPLVED